jgi:hypothetical protein
MATREKRHVRFFLILEKNKSFLDFFYWFENEKIVTDCGSPYQMMIDLRVLCQFRGAVIVGVRLGVVI